MRQRAADRCRTKQEKKKKEKEKKKETVFQRSEKNKSVILLSPHCRSPSAAPFATVSVNSAADVCGGVCKRPLDAVRLEFDDGKGERERRRSVHCFSLSLSSFLSLFPSFL